jgi:hypothetical protein
MWGLARGQADEVHTMAMKNMTLAEQVAEGKLLCDDTAKIAVIFGQDAAVAALRERLQRRQETLTAIQQQQGALDAQVQEKTDMMLVQDSDNDRRIDAIHGMGRSAVKIAQDSAVGDGLASALNKVFAATLAQLINGSYAGMGGEAERIERSLTAEDRAQLRKVGVDGYTLMDALEEWFIGCRALTAMSQERDQLLTRQDSSRVGAGEVLEARNQWVREVNALVAALEASEEIDEDDQRLALASLRATEARADLRAAERRRLTVI